VRYRILGGALALPAATSVALGVACRNLSHATALHAEKLSAAPEQRRLLASRVRPPC